MSFAPTKTFEWRGQTVTIDLSPFGSSGSNMGVRERAEHAADILNQLALLKAEYVHDHELAKQAAGQGYEAHCNQTGTKPSATGKSNYIHEQEAYLKSRVIRDWIDAAFSVMKDVHCPRLNRREASDNWVEKQQMPSAAPDMGAVPSSAPAS